MMRHSRRAVAGLISAAALALTACGNSSPSAGGGSGYGTGTPTAVAQAASGALKAEATPAGMVLASPQGDTLYYFSADKPGSGTSACSGSCADAWPALKAPVEAPAGTALPGPLGMITRSDGVKQITVNGYPLYLYTGDKAPGQANGNGLAGQWHVIKVKVTSTRRRVLKTEVTSAGTVLASPAGDTLYYFTADKPGSGVSACTGSCAAAWPALKAPVHVPAGLTLPGPLGVITLPDGIKQVTINGYPIYLYAGDKAPGQANGNGLAGKWHVIKLGGGTTKSGSGGSGSGGYGY